MKKKINEKYMKWSPKLNTIQRFIAFDFLTSNRPIWPRNMPDWVDLYLTSNYSQNFFLFQITSFTDYISFGYGFKINTCR